MPEPELIETDAPPGRFDLTARFYEPLARLYSRGAIHRAKASQVERMSTGDRVLYVGVGTGEDALLAARRGARLTCVELSGRMLGRARDRLRREGLDAELIRGDVRDLDRPGAFDAVVANFFLNCFAREEMRRMLGHLAGLVRVGGRLFIADVAPPRGSRGARLAHRLYNAAGIGLYWALGLVPLHRIYDYEAEFGAFGLRTARVAPFRVIPGGPVSFESIEAIRER